MVRFLITLSVFAFLPAAGIAAEIVPASEVGEDLFDGRPITSTDARGRRAELVFAAGGAVTVTPQAGEPRAGTWRLAEGGFCMTVGGNRREGCYLVLRRGDGAIAAVPLADAFAWQRPVQAAAEDPVSGLAGSQP